MEIIFAIGMFVGALLAMTLVIREALRWKMLRRLERLGVAERNRNRFGVLRTKLMELAREEKLETSSRRFSTLYFILSVLMRSPQEYGQVARSLLSLGDEQGERNQDPISAVEGELLIDLSKAIDLLCRDFCPSYRVATWVVEHFGSERDKLMPVWLYLSEHWSPAREVQQMRQAESTLRRLGNEAVFA